MSTDNMQELAAPDGSRLRLDGECQTPEAHPNASSSDRNLAATVSKDEESFKLSKLATLYQERLSSPPLDRRFAHHIAHMAPEGWLCQELAWLVNEECERAALSGWHANLERQKVDVTLVNPEASEEIYIEMKLVPPDWWMLNWREVYRDLGFTIKGRGQTKPAANFAVCFIRDHVIRPKNMRSRTHKLYDEYLSYVPNSPSAFVPLPSIPSFPPYILSPNRHDSD